MLTRPLLLLVIWVGLTTDLEPTVRADEAVPHWSFQKPVRPTVPAKKQLRHGERVQNPVDAFVLARLEQEGLAPAPLADPWILVRRAYFDLLGLPPSPEQVETFVNDSSPDAWGNLIDQLLESKHYGERWGRHWLDVARYADSAGFEGDAAYPNAWRYRDYIVSSFNDDKPYNMMVQEQIAGDEIWPDNLDLDPKRVYIPTDTQKQHLQARIGTGLFGFGPRVGESTLDARRLHYETLTDWVDTAGSVFLGLTLQCARCHDHKFDALTQEDYFAMQAIFTSSIEMDLPTITPIEIASWRDSYPAIVGAHEARLAYKVFQQRIGEDELSPEQKVEEKRLRDQIVERVMKLQDVNPSVPHTPFDPLMQVPKATVLGHERPELIKPVHLLERGELYLPRQKIHPALPAALARSTNRKSKVTGPYGSRKELALWLTQSGHPLTARVMVNRIWQWHFGQGLVATPNDFGKHGAPPTHPDLLDWLATEFVARNWSIKELHRLIMASNTYRATSRFSTAEHQQRDPENRYLWRFNRRRLEGEALWDAIHTTAGTINLAVGGRPVMPPLAEDEIAALRRKDRWPVSGDPDQHTRRGLYILVLRNFRFPMFDVFDAPVNSVSCPQRDVTTVTPQALFGLNSPSVYRQARQLACRVVRESAGGPEQWVQQLWKIALARPISAQETEETLRLLAVLSETQSVEQIQKTLGDSVESLAPASPQQAAALVKLCLAVYNLNEFSFIH
ncbi:MAG: hypothetical protein CMJ81_01400 [Planctomycetaceae bacterium]|nr:hypothetical protein [Planctomycetaceae bacterium]